MTGDARRIKQQYIWNFLMPHQSDAKAVQLTFMSDAFLMTYRVAIHDGPSQRNLIK